MVLSTLNHVRTWLNLRHILHAGKNAPLVKWCARPILVRNSAIYHVLPRVMNDWPPRDVVTRLVTWWAWQCDNTWHRTGDQVQVYKSSWSVFPPPRHTSTTLNQQHFTEEQKTGNLDWREQGFMSTSEIRALISHFLCQQWRWFDKNLLIYKILIHPVTPL